VVQVAFAEVTQIGTLRHPVLVGLRTDVLPSEVIWDDELGPASGVSTANN
jgi:ATP-dependent DNA ligase